MESQHPYRPRVSREMRLLLTAGLLAIAALWLLARVRFRDLPVTPNPIPAVLTQLSASPRYDDLAEEIAGLRTRLDGALVPLATQMRGPLPHATLKQIVAALRFRDGMAVALLPHEASVEQTILARDRASGLTVVRVSNESSAPAPPLWAPRALQRPRYFIATAASLTGVFLRPAFAGTLEATESPSWPEPIWSVPNSSDLTPGSFLFTSEAELAGLVIARAGRQGVVPAAVLFAEVERLLARPNAPTGSVGVDVQALTAPVAAVTGASAGVVVIWVEQDGAARGRVMVGDVIEAVDDEPLTSEEQWAVRVARLAAGETIRLRVRRAGKVQATEVQATSLSVPPVLSALGLVMRGRSGTGSEVVRVGPNSAAERAGLMPGDIVTVVGDIRTPTPARVTRVFASLPEGRGVLLGVTRGDAHLVTTLER